MKKLTVYCVLVLLTSIIHAQQINNVQHDSLNYVTKESLNEMEQSIVKIAALTAKGNFVYLKPALNKGLDDGLTVNQIKEVIIHLYAYCGFPKSIRGLQTFMEVLDERKEKGINDAIGKDASAIDVEKNKYERGKENLEKLTGIPQTDFRRGYAEFAPTIEIFLKEHLFADIFDRDILTYTERELVTISVLSATEGVEPMLRSHLNICIYQGYTQEQLQQFIGIIKSTIGEEEATKAQVVLDEVLKSSQQQ